MADCHAASDSRPSGSACTGRLLIWATLLLIALCWCSMQGLDIDWNQPRPSRRIMGLWGVGLVLIPVLWFFVMTVTWGLHGAQDAALDYAAGAVLLSILAAHVRKTLHTGGTAACPQSLKTHDCPSSAHINERGGGRFFCKNKHHRPLRTGGSNFAPGWRPVFLWLCAFPRWSGGLVSANPWIPILMPSGRRASGCGTMSPRQAGMLSDANGTPLAVSASCWTVQDDAPGDGG